MMPTVQSKTHKKATFSHAMIDHMSMKKVALLDLGQFFVKGA
jgi:hypothetical protein